jgi:uncharacterized protein (TIGR02453 family)
MPNHFTPETMKFLRGLARNNDRDWFNDRKDVYERALKAPMLAVIEDINASMETFAPDYLRPPQKIMMRIYRDIRFSNDKRPYKQHLAAWWSRRGMEKTSGGGFYLQISPKEIMLAAGVYMPQRDQLLQLRRWMSEHHASYRALTKKLLSNKSAAFAGIDPQALTRMPKGFASDDPTDELLRARNWGVRSTLPAEAALEPDFAAQIVKRMKLATPLIDTLNNAILESPTTAASRPKPMF